MILFTLYYPIWKEALVLAWPIVLNHIFTTAMRTTDMVLMGFFGPAAVTAVGLGDVWERIILRIGMGLGAGSIALISQETGAAKKISTQNTDHILTQIIISGFLISIPFILIGWLIPEKLISLFGAAPAVILLAAQYLSIMFAAAPFRLLNLISARSLQGTGDTRTPMVVGIISNIINISFSIFLSMGIGPFPGLGVVGVGWGTFIARMTATIIYMSIFILPRGNLSLRISFVDWDFTITRQLIKISIPSILQGGYQTLIAFPFNSLVLLFGTEAAAAYHIGRRIQQQLMAPLQRAYGTVTTILAGKKLGEGLDKETRKVTKGMLWLAALTIGIISGILFIFAPWFIKLFSHDQGTIRFGIGFLRAFSIGAPIMAFYTVLSGLLIGAGDTRTPFYGLVSSQTLFKLGLSYILSVTFGLKIIGVYIGLVFDFIGQAGWVAWRFRSNQWIENVRELLEERHKHNKIDGKN